MRSATRPIQIETEKVRPVLDSIKAQIETQTHNAFVFCHLHKTGGTTIEKELVPHFKDKAIRVHTEEDVRKLESLLAAGGLSDAGNYLIYGHRAVEFRKRLNAFIPSYCFTLVRRPLSLFQSNYSFRILRHARTDLTPEKFLENSTPNLISDFYGFESFSAGAKEIRDEFAYVGLMERMSETLAVIGYLTGLDLKRVRSQNITKPENYSTIDGNTAMKFLERSATDSMLYEYVHFLHERIYSDLRNKGLVKDIELSVDSKSYNAPIEPNFDLEANSDKVSLFLAGEALLKKADARAIQFFDKSFFLDWSMLPRIGTALITHDSSKAKAWLDQKIEFLDEQGNDRWKKAATDMRNKL